MFPSALLRRVFPRLSDSRRVQRAVHRLLRLATGPRLSVWFHPKYRLPLPSFEGATGGQPRRADYVAWYLVESGIIDAADLKTPERISYRDLARTHTSALLDSLNESSTLARVFATTPDLPVDEILKSLRYACGGTLGAAREALATKRPVLSLFGGFHHAEPGRAGGFCALNDVAVAIATLRAGGFSGRVAVIDLDAHPPDGTAACLENDERAWIGSISGSAWVALPGVDETVLPQGTGDEVYLEALHALLGRMPKAELAFVLAGGDVLAGDHLGLLGLSLSGAKARDAAVLGALGHIGSVWLPAGGYHPDSWRLLAGTALVLAGSPVPGVPSRYDPLSRSFAAIARTLSPEELGDDLAIDFYDIAEDLHAHPPRHKLLLGYYTAEGLELALDRYGILDHLRRLGYDDFRGVVDAGNPGDRARLFGGEHLLIELCAEKRHVSGREVLYVHWLTLRHPRVKFDALRPRLPGQEVPGLGLAQEISELLVRMADRLHLGGVAFSPSHYHMAYAARHDARFVSPSRQAEFEAMVSDLSGTSLLDTTTAVAEGRVLRDGVPYTWEATEMVRWRGDPPEADLAAPAPPSRPRFTMA